MSLRILSSFCIALPLALSLGACDGVDDQDAPAAEDLALDDEDAAELDELALADADDEDAAPTPHASVDDVKDEDRETALCLWHSQKAYLNLSGVFYGVLGNVELQTNCNSAFARVNITNSSTGTYENGIKVELQYWNAASSVAVPWGTKHTYASNRFNLSTLTTTFATGTWVRACGQIDSAIPLDSTPSPVSCTAWFAISSSS